MAKILSDSRNAKFKFGFAVGAGNPITSAPKLSTQWFVEFRATGGENIEEYSSYAKSVSQIGIQTTTQPIDKYGRRIYVPTRVDFPEVTISLYDKVDGSTFKFMQDIYDRHFKNQSMDVDANLSNELSNGSNFGRKITSTNTGIRNFQKVTLYHWFGNHTDGTGFAQRVVLVNPIVTSMSFSPSSYESTELRTIDISLQPENIVIDKSKDGNIFPEWMKSSVATVEETPVAEELKNSHPDPLAEARNVLDNAFDILDDIDNTINGSN